MGGKLKPKQRPLPWIPVPYPCKIRNRTQRLRLIGDWFESLFNDIIPGSRRSIGLVNNYQNGDLEVGDLLFEVKGVSNGQRPQLFVDQFNELMRNVPFPYSHLVYLISSYRVLINRKGRSFSQLTERTPTMFALDEFLAEKTKETYAVHHRLLSHLLKHGESGELWSRGTVIRLTLTELRRFAGNERLLRKHGLRCEVIRFRTMFRGYRVGPIKLTIIAPPRVITRIKKLFERSLCAESTKENP